MTASRTWPACAVWFSGGKDSMLALDRAVRAGCTGLRLVTLYDHDSGRVRFHGVPAEVMRAQADALGLPMRCYSTTPSTFEEVFLAALAEQRAEGIGGVIFGNIHLADVRAWYEERVRAAGLEHIEPIWGEPPVMLVREVIARGYRAVLTCVEAACADRAWLGRPITPELVDTFAAAGIDPCGERGEYHTLVTDGPLFRHPLAVRLGVVPGEIHEENGFCQLDVRLETLGA
jgi:uncharacterized protein (TIGR00290 family)